jgi:hypothetical protein
MSSTSIEEEDEYHAIQKFDALLHYEEQKQAAARAEERKRLLVIELEKQKALKEEKIKKQQEEDRAYHKQVLEHCKVLDQKEIDKKNAIK